jgi:hypothetical protein
VALAQHHVRRLPFNVSPGAGARASSRRVDVPIADGAASAGDVRLEGLLRACAARPNPRGSTPPELEGQLLRAHAVRQRGHNEPCRFGFGSSAGPQQSLQLYLHRDTAFGDGAWLLSAQDGDADATLWTLDLTETLGEGRYEVLLAESRDGQRAPGRGPLLSAYGATRSGSTFLAFGLAARSRPRTTRAYAPGGGGEPTRRGRRSPSGESIPEPIAARRYSGKFVVCVPPEVHRRQPHGPGRGRLLQQRARPRHAETT